MLAIVTALQWIEELRLQKVILCSDSRLALLPIQSFTSICRQDTVNEVNASLYRLQRQNILITFMWIQSYRKAMRWQIPWLSRH